MSVILPNRRLMDNAQWLDLFARATDIVPKADIDALEAETVEAIRRTVAGKNAAYAWSGGSDSSALSRMCRLAGVKPCMIGICDLEYPAFMAWLNENAPEQLTVVNTGQDLDWLAARQGLLFPDSSRSASPWYTGINHESQRRYVVENGVDILITGRRRADSNYVGRNGQNIYTNQTGVTRYSPMADWKHEQLLAYIQYHGLKLPPLYEWENGWRNGTHPWPARQFTDGIADGWRVIYNIDPSIVIAAAEKIESARAYLEGIA